MMDEVGGCKTTERDREMLALGIRAALEAAAKECDHWYEDSVLAANNCFEGRDQGSAIIHKERADAFHEASVFIRSLSPDDILRSMK